MPMYRAPAKTVAPTPAVVLQAGSNVHIDNTDPTAPVISVAIPSPPSVPVLQAGSNVTIDNSNPTAPVISVAVPPGTTPVVLTGVDFGSHAASQATFTYHAVTVAARALISSLVITPSGAGTFDIDVKPAADGSGEQFLAATGQNGAYNVSWPWFFKNDASTTMYIGIRNTSIGALSFTLTRLRAEKFA